MEFPVRESGRFAISLVLPRSKLKINSLLMSSTPAYRHEPSPQNYCSGLTAAVQLAIAALE
jgi:hypothetical protein